MASYAVHGVQLGKISNVFKIFPELPHGTLLMRHSWVLGSTRATLEPLDHEALMGGWEHSQQHGRHPGTELGATHEATHEQLLR